MCIHVCLCACVPPETRVGHPMSCNWNYRKLWAAMRVLIIEPRFSAEGTNACNYLPILSPLPFNN